MNIEITDKMLEDFYNCFDKKKGTDFELFLKLFLKDIGFEEIEVVGRSGDNGVDLKCYKNIISGNNSLTEKYIVQAKKYALSTHIAPTQIRDIQANEEANHRIFITTSSYSAQSIKIASADNNTRPVTLISGRDILEYYLTHPEKDVIFDWDVKVSKNRVRELIEQEANNISEKNNLSNIDEDKQDVITKMISRNDIRARILPIPSQIFDIIKENDSFDIEAFGQLNTYNINKKRRYFGGITQLFRQAGYLGYSGEENKNSFWKMSKDNKFIILELK